MRENRYITFLLRDNAKRFTDKPAVVDARRTLTWGQLYDEVMLAAFNLREALGNTQQQVVSLLLANEPDYITAYLAILEAGNIAAPLDVIYKPLELKAIIKQLQPSAVITDIAGKDRLSGTRTPIILTSKLKTNKRTSVSSPKYMLPPTKQIATILFTSGTTGQPKATMYTHANHLWNIKVCSDTWDWNQKETLLISLRLSHWYGLVMGLSGALYHGNTLYLQERFDPIETLESLSSGKITMFTHGPQAYMKMLTAAQRSQRSFDLSSVRLLISGSGPLPPAVWKKFRKRFGIEILECYGSSETGRIASNLLTERLPGSPGRALPEVSLKLGTHGEVLIKSPGVFAGYYRNASATQSGYAEDGWWNTGDIGQIKNDRVILKGRSHEKIRRSGYSISPRDVEWALYQNPNIDEVHVMGRQSNDVDDELVYFIVSSLSKKQIISYTKEHLPSVWRPAQVVMLKDIPRTANGKPHLTLLRSMA